jgi:anti-sigma regulatory factor (Ser/Thr protein kinase)
VSTDRCARILRRPNLDVVLAPDTAHTRSWSDVVALPCSRTLISIGWITPVKGADVTGLVQSFSTAVAALALSECPPGLLLRHLDALVLVSPGVERVAVSLAQFDAAGGEFVVGDAGMPAPVIYRPRDDQLIVLDGSMGAELGIRTHHFRQQTSCVEPEDILALVPARQFDARRGPVTPLPQWVRRIAESAADISQLATILDRVSGGADLAVAVVRDQGIPVKEFKLAADEEIAVVRQGVRQLLAEWELADLTNDIVLVVSEMLANALHHADGSIAAVRIHRRPDAVVVEVSDRGASMPLLGQPAFDDDRGRGMFLIDRLADRWGTRRTDDGKVVWCELAIPESMSQPKCLA